jgi:hypothetical protein
MSVGHNLMHVTHKVSENYVKFIVDCSDKLPWIFTYFPLCLGKTTINTTTMSAIIT